MDQRMPISDRISQYSIPGLYIHIPFCRSKCSYCSFFSIADRKLISKFTDAVCREMAARSGEFKEFDTVYFGGGTPTVIGIEPLQKIVKAVHENFNVNANNEYTIEANSTGLDVAFLSALLAMDFNRISIGVQSFNDEILKFLGRTHNAVEAKQAFKNARLAGFKNIGLDLIYGIPGIPGISGQDMACWMEGLKQAVELSPEHLSCYQLTIENETPLSKRFAKGDLSILDEKLQYEFFIKTSEFLEINGYVHYEISNYSRGPGFTSRHNQKYWDHTPYLGIGPAAHSFSGIQRCWNCSDLKKYVNLLAHSKSPRENFEEIGSAEICLEMLCLGLRTRKGISLRDFELVRGRPLDRRESGFLERLCTEGYAELRDGCFRPTLNGMTIADRLALELASFFDL